jgi:hypothetical protein
MDDQKLLRILRAHHTYALGQQDHQALAEATSLLEELQNVADSAIDDRSERCPSTRRE